VPDAPLTLEQRRRRLEDKGCRVDPPAAEGGVWRCGVETPDGATLAGRGTSAEQAEDAALARAEIHLGIDLDEASAESFPSSDPPALGGPGL